MVVILIMVAVDEAMMRVVAIVMIMVGTLMDKINVVVAKWELGGGG
jgi:hypothetical protein